MNDFKVVFLSDWKQNPYKDLLSDGLNFYGVEAVEYEWSTFFIKRVLQSEKPNVLHLHTLHPFVRSKTRLRHWIKLFIFTFQLYWLRLMKIETVWTVHEWSDKVSGGDDEIPHLSCWLIGKFLKAIIVHCKSTRIQIEDAFQLKEKQKIFVIPHGNYIDFYPNKVDKSQARNDLGIPENSVVFMLFGDIYRYKGVLESIHAFNRVDDESTFLLIAGMPRQENLEEEIFAAIEGCQNIKFVPTRIPIEDVQIFMNASDCVLVPYTVFTTSGVAILAMSFGRACIAPNLGFFSDVFNESGAYLYDTSNNDGLFEAIKRAATNTRKLEEMGSKNLALAHKWNWKYVAKETLNTYNKS